MASTKFLAQIGIALLLATERVSPKVFAQIKVYNVNEIHELYSENELAAKNLYHNKNAVVFGRVDKVDGKDVIIEGNSEFGRLFCKYSELDINKVLELREDSGIEVHGTLKISWSPFGMFLRMDNCRII